MKRKIIKNIVTLASLLPLLSHAQITDNSNNKNKKPDSAIVGHIYTDKGNAIEVYRLAGNDKASTKNITNNNGWTFAQGQVWIKNDQVPTILKDEYKEISFSQIQDKDIFVRYKNKQIVYTLTVCQPKNTNKYCKDNVVPDMFLFVLSPKLKFKTTEDMKFYRYIQPVNK